MVPVSGVKKDPIRVMIVDDDAHVRIAVKTILAEAGYNVIDAEGGKECIAILKSEFCGVLLLDIMMPGMDGWDTITKILEEDLFHGIVIAMLTAKSTPDNKMIGLQEWVLDYVTKPFDPDELVSKVRYYASFLPLREKIEADQGP
ncbi:MAG: response regulator [Methanospirillum sp.]|nr:response regulator [Methanospirillum sp.]MDD1727503.1 response regulator [Methanospirillum sp.]